MKLKLSSMNYGYFPAFFEIKVVWFYLSMISDYFTNHFVEFNGTLNSRCTLRRRKKCSGNATAEFIVE